MSEKVLYRLVFIVCFVFFITGCPRTVVHEGSAMRHEEMKSKPGVEQQNEMRPMERQKEEQPVKEFNESLVAKKEPGIAGEVFESKLLKDIHFDFDKYDIHPGDEKILNANAAWLKKNPGITIQIEGNCDERGTTEYNLALGERRANSAKKYLVTLGIPAGRISTISYGKEKPLDPGHNEAAWAKNRRDHFIILSK